MGLLGNAVVGIDPGANTGVAIFESGEMTRIFTTTPSDILKWIANIQPGLLVFEDSRLISHTFTTTRSRPAALKMARNVGEVDAYCRLIEAECRAAGVRCIGISPSGKGAKLDAATFENMTGWVGRSNQHERDAAMVAFKFRRAKREVAIEDCEHQSHQPNG